jgi:hypothetical protein
MRAVSPPRNIVNLPKTGDGRKSNARHLSRVARGTVEKVTPDGPRTVRGTDRRDDDDGDAIEVDLV